MMESKVHGGRRLVVDGLVWYWRVGRQSVIMRHGDTRLLCPCWQLAGMSHPDQWERAKWKGSRHDITPSVVAEFISNANAGEAT